MNNSEIILKFAQITINNYADDRKNKRSEEKDRCFEEVSLTLIQDVSL